VNIVPLKANQFKRKNPHLQLITAGATKARKLTRDLEPRYGVGWIMSRRSVLFLSDQGLHCGNWFIPLNTITEAKLIKTPAGNILKVATTEEDFYQFGLNRNKKWDDQSVLPITIEKSDLVLSATSLVIRLIAVGYFLWEIFRDITQQDFSVVTIFTIVLVIYFSVPIFRALESYLERQLRNG
jgi:hypothetical protein